MRTALTVTIRVKGKWWKGKAWAAIKGLAPEWLIEMLEVFVKILTPLEEKRWHQLQESPRERKTPSGVGPLTVEILRREVGDWGRFNNRRQVFGYMGLCPRELSQRLLARWT